MPYGVVYDTILLGNNFSNGPKLTAFEPDISELWGIPLRLFFRGWGGVGILWRAENSELDKNSQENGRILKIYAMVEYDTVCHVQLYKLHGKKNVFCDDGSFWTLQKKVGYRDAQCTCKVIDKYSIRKIDLT